MYTQEITVNNEVGLHARPATFFIQKANEFKSGIWLEKDERRVNAKSLLGVLSLGIVKGTTITLLADGAGEIIKYGVLADYGAKKEALQDLLLYWSSKEGKLISLKEYAAAMPEDQKYIYYANGESRERLGQLPQMEKLQQKGYDVLFMTDEVDGFVPQTLGKYQEKELKSITAGDLGLETEEEKKAAEEKSEKSKQTLDFVKKTLGDKVKDVRLSDNLGSHPVSVVPAEGMTFEMEKYFKRVDPNSGMKADRILEFNADHPIFAKLQIAVAQDEKKAEDLVKILYTQALLMADLPVENAGEYTDLVCSLIS